MGSTLIGSGLEYVCEGSYPRSPGKYSDFVFLTPCLLFSLSFFDKVIKNSTLPRIVLYLTARKTKF